MRIAHIITRLILGGAQENTLYTVEDLVERHGDEVVLITGPSTGPEGDLLDRARRKGIKLEIVPALRRAIHPVADFQAYRAILRLLRALQPQVVHTHSSKAGIIGRAAAAKAGTPAIIHTIHGLPFHPYEAAWRNWAYRFAERWAAARTDVLIAVCQAMIDQAVEAGIAPREKFVKVWSGMEVEPFLTPPRTRQEVRRELGLADDAIVVGKVARLFQLKGHDDVIDAARTLAPKAPRLRFLFVGGGEWRERLEAKVKAVGLADRFVFTGLVPAARIPELIGAMDILVHASYREGLARALPQALLSAKPVVSYNIDGAREVVIPGETGYLAPAGDVDLLAEDLWKLIEDQSKREAFGRTGRERFAEQFRHDRASVQIREIYRETLARKGISGN